MASTPYKISACRLGIEPVQIHTKIINSFSSTPPGSPQESKNIPNSDVIHLSDSKELFLIRLLLFSLRLYRSPSTPAAIIIVTSLCFPGLIASRIQQTFCRRRNKFVKKKSAVRESETRQEKKKMEKGNRTVFQIPFTNTDRIFGMKNKLHELSLPYQFR